MVVTKEHKITSDCRICR